MARRRLLGGVESPHVTKLARRSPARSRRYVTFAAARSVVAPFCTGRCRTAASNARTPRGTGSSPATTWADPSPPCGAPTASCTTCRSPGTMSAGCVTDRPAAWQWTTVGAHPRSVRAELNRPVLRSRAHRHPSDAAARQFIDWRFIPMSVTDELLRKNDVYARSFDKGSLPLPPANHLAVLACMDARLDVHKILGLNEGDAHVIRNAGGVATDDAIRSLVISQRLLGTNEIILIHHTDCGMLTFKDDEVKGKIESEVGSGLPSRSKRLPTLTKM